ncbi:hypothetical protein [Kitasatospora sp. HPMI-4]
MRLLGTKITKQIVVAALGALAVFGAVSATEAASHTQADGQIVPATQEWG